MFALILFIDYELTDNIVYSRAHKNELPAKLAFSVTCMLAANLTTFLGLFICSYERFTHCEFPRLHNYWFRVRYGLEIIVLSMLAWRWGVSLPQSKEIVIVVLQLADILLYHSECRELYRNSKDLNDEMKSFKWITDESLRRLHDRVCTICFRDIE